MAKKQRTLHTCSECGYSSPKWLGRCPECGSWGTLQEQTPLASAASASGPVSLTALTPSAPAAPITSIDAAATRTTVQRQGPIGESPDPRWAARLVEESAEGMAGSDFPARPGPWCRTCPARTSCPARPEGERL